MQVAAGEKLPSTTRSFLRLQPAFGQLGNREKVAMGMTMKKTMLGAALVAGLFATGAAAANAEPRGFYNRGFDRPAVRGDVRGGYVGREFARPVPRFYGGVGVAVGGPVVDTYVPPCPGDGYVWTAGYYNAGVWIPGAWGFRGRVGFDRGYAGYGYRGGFHDNHIAYDRGFRGRR
jgi:hypothetical protein